MKTLVLSVVFAMTSIMNSVCSNSNGFAYNIEMNGNRIESKTVYKVADNKYLHRHLKYNFTYDAQGRVVIKEVLKWNIVSEAYDKQYCLNFNYEDDSETVEYIAWNAEAGAYDGVKSKAVYQVKGDDVNYQSYEWNPKNNAWNLMVQHEIQTENAQLLAAIL